MEHDRAYHRFKDEIAKKYKMKIVKETWHKSSQDLLENPKFTGKLIKGKAFCSCLICNGGNKRKVLGPKISEIRKEKIEE